MSDTSTLGERLAVVRKRRGLSQRELAKASGVSLTVISKLEQGERSGVRMQTARNLAVALRVPTMMLMTATATEDHPDEDLGWEMTAQALAGRVPQVEQVEEEVSPAGVTAAMRDLAPALTAHRYTAVQQVLPISDRSSSPATRDRQKSG